MKKSTDWIDLVRSTEPFARIADYTAAGISLSAGDAPDFTFPALNDKAGFKVSMDNFHPITLDGKPAFIAATNPVSLGDPRHPVVAEPAAAQSSTTMLIIWTETNNDTISLGFDETVGAFPPEFALNVEYDGKPMIGAPGGDTGNFEVCKIVPHRTDGFPAVLLIRGLRKWYNPQGLHRKGTHAALRADYVGAMWFENGEPYRATGPTCVGLEGYQEFHKNGNYQGYRVDATHTTWRNSAAQEFANDVEGGIDVLANRYFRDTQDEFAYAATFNS